jgi:hypothetical protein
MGVRGQRHAPVALSPERDPVPIVQEAGWAPGPVWTDAENLAPTGIRSPDRPARSESLYRLRYKNELTLRSSDLPQRLTGARLEKKFQFMLRRHKVNCRVHRGPSLVPISSQMNPVHDIVTYKNQSFCSLMLTQNAP